MSEFINEKSLAEEIVKAIDNNLKGQARRMFTDSHDAVQQPVVDFIKTVSAVLEKRFQN